ncbi:DUF1508 domain-containing protein [Fretibacter rubidus]|uniref:YegP family protein n=1 Tax=Fretibacter rubidus TaxID=570162 RepID=UPI00352B2A29
MAEKQNDDYKAIGFYKKAAADRQRGFVKFEDGDLHYFTYLSGGEIGFISQGYTSVAGRDNGIESVRKNMKDEKRYRISKNGSQYRYGLFAGNGQEIAVGPNARTEKSAQEMADRVMGKAPTKPAKAKATKAKAAPKKTKTDGRIENYKPLAFYQQRSAKLQDGFGSFSDDDAHYFTYNKSGKIVLISESYTSKAARDNGIVSVKKNMPIKERYEHHRHKNGKYYFDLNAGNRQEIATSIWYGSSAAALAGAAALRGEVEAKPAKAKAAQSKVAKPKAANVEDNYHPLAFYEKHGNKVKDGFDTFEHNGAHYFTYNRAGKIVLISESYPTKAARETGRASTEKNMKLEKRYDYRSLKNGKHDYRIKAGNGKEVARSVWYGSAAAAATGAAYLLGKRKAAAKPKSKPKAAPIAAAAPVIAAAAKAAPTKDKRDKDDDYLACKEYHDRDVNDKANNVALFRHENGKFYFALYDDDGDVRLRSEGFISAKDRDQELSGVLRLKDDERYYKRITKGAHYLDVLYDETGREVGRSCLKKVAAAAVAAPIAAAAVAAAAPAVAAAPVAATTAATAAATGATGAGIWGWLKWVLLGLLALLALLLLSRCFAGGDNLAAPVDVPDPAVQMVSCWDGTEAANQAACPTKIDCWDGSVAASLSACPVQPEPEPAPEPDPMPEPIAVPEPVVAAPQATVSAPEPARMVAGAITRMCGPSDITLFNVPSFETPRPIRYLGSNPQFGNSHGLSPRQFYEKLNTAYNSGGVDRAFLNYMARALGYSGFRAMDASMFSEDSLAFGETGLLGFSQMHALQYSKLNTNDRDREAFRVQSANGQDVHFMKTCGNYMYVCQ